MNILNKWKNKENSLTRDIKKNLNSFQTRIIKINHNKKFHNKYMNQGEIKPNSQKERIILIN